MPRSVIDIITSAVSAARMAGLDSADERVAARAVLLANDASLTPDIARMLVDQHYFDLFPGREPVLPSCAANL